MGGSLTLAIWIIISIAALVADLLTSTLLFVWFTIGGIGAIIAMIFGCSVVVQIGIFAAISLLLILIVYPIVKRTIKGHIKRTPTMEENFIGRVITIDQDISDKVLFKLDGIYWTLKTQSAPIKKGDKVRIVAIEGNKLLVEPIQENI